MNPVTPADITYCEQGMTPPPRGHDPLHFIGIPEACDVCGRDIADGLFFADAEIPASGLWGYLCPACITEQRVRFGWGIGQLYQRESGNPPKWLLVAGYPDTSDDNDN